MFDLYYFELVIFLIDITVSAAILIIAFVINRLIFSSLFILLKVKILLINPSSLSV